MAKTLLLGGAFCCFAGATEPNGPEILSSFENVQFGMTEEELQEARPAAEAFVIFDEPENATADDLDVWVENLAENPLFDSVDYTFVNDRLCVIKWQSTSKGDFAELRARILHGAVEKWGEGFERLVLDAGPFGPLPSLRWTEESEVVLLSYTPSPVDDTTEEEEPALPHLVQLVTYQRSCLPADVEELLRSLRPALENSGVFRDLELPPNGPRFQ